MPLPQDPQDPQGPQVPQDPQDIQNLQKQDDQQKQQDGQRLLSDAYMTAITDNIHPDKEIATNNDHAKAVYNFLDSMMQNRQGDLEFLMPTLKIIADIYDYIEIYSVFYPPKLLEGDLGVEEDDDELDDDYGLDDMEVEGSEEARVGTSTGDGNGGEKQGAKIHGEGEEWSTNLACKI